jgi:hypothetical protein
MSQAFEKLYTASFECPPYACVELSQNISPQVGHQLAKLVAHKPCIVSLTAKSMALCGAHLPIGMVKRAVQAVGSL